MAQIVFDEGELEGSKYLGEGTYNCLITRVEAKTSKDKGTPMVEIEFTAQNGRGSRDWFVTEGNKFKLASLALACGFTKEQLIKGEFTTQALQGRGVRLVREVKGTDSQGRKNYENSYLAVEGRASAPQADDTIPF